MEYAVIEASGKQFKVNPGTILELDRIKETNNLSFDRVLLYVSDAQVQIGKPYVKDIVVTATRLDDFKGEKTRVARFTAKSRHRRVVGFRPHLTRIKIEKIVKTSKSQS